MTDQPIGGVIAATGGGAGAFTGANRHDLGGGGISGRTHFRDDPTAQPDDWEETERWMQQVDLTAIGASVAGC